MMILVHLIVTIHSTILALVVLWKSSKNILIYLSDDRTHDTLFVQHAFELHHSHLQRLGVAFGALGIFRWLCHSNSTNLWTVGSQAHLWRNIIRMEAQQKEDGKALLHRHILGRFLPGSRYGYPLEWLTIEQQPLSPDITPPVGTWIWEDPPRQDTPTRWLPWHTSQQHRKATHHPHIKLLQVQGTWHITKWSLLLLRAWRTLWMRMRLTINVRPHERLRTPTSQTP